MDEQSGLEIVVPMPDQAEHQTDHDGGAGGRQGDAEIGAEKAAAVDVGRLLQGAGQGEIKLPEQEDEQPALEPQAQPGGQDEGQHGVGDADTGVYHV